MKTSSPNVLFNHRAIELLEKTSQVMKQKLLLFIMLVSLCTGAFAQSGRPVGQSETIVVTDVNSLLFSSGSTTSRPAATTSVPGIDVPRIKELVTQVQSSYYLYGSDVRTYGDRPTNLFTDLSSLNQVNSSIMLKNNIEMVTVRINTASELNSTIDLAVFSNFPNLRYIYFISGLNTTSDVIARNIVNYQDRFNILYKIDRGDRNQ